MAPKRSRSISPDLPSSSAAHQVPLERLYPEAGPAPKYKPKKGDDTPAPEKRLKVYKRGRSFPLFKMEISQLNQLLVNLSLSESYSGKGRSSNESKVLLCRSN